MYSEVSLQPMLKWGSETSGTGNGPHCTAAGQGIKAPSESGLGISGQGYSCPTSASSPDSVTLDKLLNYSVLQLSSCKWEL